MNNICTGKDTTDSSHCWHFTGIQLNNFPGKYEQICCFCGILRYINDLSSIIVSINLGKHGKFRPKQI